MAAADLKGELEGPHVIVIGECAGGDALAVTAQEEIVAHVAVGQEVELIARYHFEPGKEERDFFRVALVSRIGETVPPAKLFQIQERKGIRSPQRGFLAHRFAFRAPGLYEGTFAIRGEEIAQARGSTDVVHWKATTKEGRIRLLVGAIETTQGPVVI